MDLQEQQRRKREEQLAADNQKRASKRAALQDPSQSNLAAPSSASTAEAPKVQVESTKYAPTIPEYALKIEFGEQKKFTPIASYNRFKLLNTSQSEEISSGPLSENTPPPGSDTPRS